MHLLHRLFHSEHLSQNQKYSFRLTIYVYTRTLQFRKIGPKWVHMARHGLILWENDATWLKTVLELLF